MEIFLDWYNHLYLRVNNLGIIRYVVNHKTIEVSSKNKEARRINRIRSEEARRINRIRKNEEKEHKKMLSVARLGRLGASLDTINQQLDFMQVVHKEVVECKTIVEYENFTLKAYFSAHFFEISDVFAELQDNVVKNSEIYKQYKRSFFTCNDFTPDKEVKRIPKRGMSVRQFKELEEKLFNEKIKTPPDDKIAIEKETGT